MWGLSSPRPSSSISRRRCHGRCESASPLVFSFLAGAADPRGELGLDQRQRLRSAAAVQHAATPPVPVCCRCGAFRFLTALRPRGAAEPRLPQIGFGIPAVAMAVSVFCFSAGSHRYKHAAAGGVSPISRCVLVVTPRPAAAASAITAAPARPSADSPPLSSPPPPG